ncbi:MAG: nitroreductase family protein [Candidatus Eisenbacteria bacterium]
MEFQDLVRARYSVRRYQLRPVENEKLQRVLETARLAPSARNAQEWRFVVVRSPETREKLKEAAYGQSYVGEAPVVIAACAEHDARTMTCGQMAYPIDVAIAVDHLTLAARDEGLGSCWICRFDEGLAKRALGIPAHGQVRVLILIPMGYPADPAPTEKPRLSLETIVRYEHW